MKKLFVFLLLAVAAVNARAAIFINNNTTYSVTLTLWAHDANNMGSCSYYCNRFFVAGGTATAYNNVTSPGLVWSQPWQIPATLVTAGSAWDAIDIVPSIEALSYATIGNPGTCASGTTYSASAAGYSINATWTYLGGGNVLVDINP